MTKTLSLLIATATLAGCASLNSLTSEVSSYTQWPADRNLYPFTTLQTTGRPDPEGDRAFDEDDDACDSTPRPAVVTVHPWRSEGDET